MRGLEDKTVVVTGGGGVIGGAICHRFGEEGARVGVFDIDADNAERVVTEIHSMGARAAAQTFDIADYAAVLAAVKVVEETLGPIDTLVNCAGWDRFMNFVDTDPAQWDKLIDINLRGPLNVTHVVLQGMVERGRGRIVSIASDAARVGSSGESVYSACKGGIISLTKTLARETATKGITVNCVCPGPTDTPILQSFAGEGEGGRKVYDALQRAIPMKRLGEPEDIPEIVAFFASDDAAFVTGQVISVSEAVSKGVEWPVRS